MPLNEGATSQILPFCLEGTEAAGDLMPIAEYTNSTLRLRGHQQGMARRELQNRAMRQISLIAAGLAQYMANRYEEGVLDNGDLDAIEAAMVAAVQTQIAAAAPPNASTTVKGLIELATTAETLAGEANDLGVTPAGLAGALGPLANVLRRTVNTGNLAAGYYVTPQALAIAAGVVTPVYLDRNVMTLAVAENITLANPATIPAGGGARIIATVDATGGRALTLGSAYRIIDGAWSADAGAVNILDLVFGGPGGLIDVQISQRGSL